MSKVKKLRRQLTNSSIKSVPADEIDYYTVIEIKNHLLKLDKENEDAFDPKDVQKYVNDTKQLRRFIQRKGPGLIEDSVQFISNILHWRKEIGLTKLNLSCFPREWFDNEFFYILENGINGSLCAIIRGQYFVKGQAIKEMANLFICYMIYHVHDRLVQMGENFQMTIIFDSSNISLSQYDIDFISFLIDLLTTKTPNIINTIVLYEIPWYGMPLLKTVMLFLPEHWRKVVVHANSKSIKKYVAKEYLPSYLPASTRDEPIEKICSLDDKKLLKDFTDEELGRVGMVKDHMDGYLKILNFWKENDKKWTKKKK